MELEIVDLAIRTTTKKTFEPGLKAGCFPYVFIVEIYNIENISYFY